MKRVVASKTRLGHPFPVTLAHLTAVSSTNSLSGACIPRLPTFVKVLIARKIRTPCCPFGIPVRVCFLVYESILYALAYLRYWVSMDNFSAVVR